MREPGGLREALLVVAKALHGTSDDPEHQGSTVLGHDEAGVPPCPNHYCTTVRAALAASPAPALDVERLARAYAAYTFGAEPTDVSWHAARRIAEMYAATAAPTTLVSDHGFPLISVGEPEEASSQETPTMTDAMSEPRTEAGRARTALIYRLDEGGYEWEEIHDLIDAIEAEALADARERIAALSLRDDNDRITAMDGTVREPRTMADAVETYRKRVLAILDKP